MSIGPLKGLNMWWAGGWGYIHRKCNQFTAPSMDVYALLLWACDCTFRALWTWSRLQTGEEIGHSSPIPIFDTSRCPKYCSHHLVISKYLREVCKSWWIKIVYSYSYTHIHVQVVNRRFTWVSQQQKCTIYTTVYYGAQCNWSMLVVCFVFVLTVVMYTRWHVILNFC